MTPSLQHRRKMLVGVRLIATFLLLSTPISVAIAWSSFNDQNSQNYKNFLAALEFVTYFNAACTLVAAALFIQRIRLDPIAKSVSFANIMTFHSWRILPAAEISSIEFESAQGRLNALVDTLRLTTSQNAARLPPGILIDHKISSLDKETPSHLFQEIAIFAHKQNPKIKIYPQSLLRQ